MLASCGSRLLLLVIALVLWKLTWCSNYWAVAYQEERKLKEKTDLLASVMRIIHEIVTNKLNPAFYSH